MRLFSAVPLLVLLAAPAAARSATAPEATTAPAPPAPAVAEAIGLAELWIREQLDYHRIPGVAVAVVHDGATLWSAGFGLADRATGAPVTPATRFRLGSVSKLFTATAVMILRDQGRLRLEDPVAKHLPWFRIRNPFPGEPAVTIEQLLTHTSGLPRDAPFPHWSTHDFPSREAVRDSMPAIELLSRPGEVYRYSNLGISLLGDVVEAAAGASWGSFVDGAILRPLGMTASLADPPASEFASLARAYLRKRPDGSRADAVHYETRAFSPAASVISTARDLAKFAAFHLAASGGEEPSATVPLSASTRREMQRARFVYPSWSGGRGLGFGVSRRDGRTYPSHGGWIGGHRSDFLLDPARKLAVVVMTNADDASPGLFSRKLLDLFADAIARATPSTPAPKVADPAWSRFVGRYTDPWEWEYEVLILDGGLVFYEHNYPPDEGPDLAINRLTPTGEPGVFRMADGEPVVFETDAPGDVVRVRRRFDFLTPKRERALD